MQEPLSSGSARDRATKFVKIFLLLSHIWLILAGKKWINFAGFEAMSQGKRSNIEAGIRAEVCWVSEPPITLEQSGRISRGQGSGSPPPLTSTDSKRKGRELVDFGRKLRHIVPSPFSFIHGAGVWHRGWGYKIQEVSWLKNKVFLSVVLAPRRTWYSTTKTWKCSRNSPRPAERSWLPAYPVSTQNNNASLLAP